MRGKTASFEIHLKVSSQFNAAFGKDKMFDGILDEHNDVWHPETGDNTPQVELNFKVVQFSLCPMLTTDFQHSLRVMRLYAIPRPGMLDHYNNMCISGFLFNNHQYSSKRVFYQCTNGTYGEPFLQTDVTPNRIELEVMKVVDRIEIDGSSDRLSFVWGLES